MRLQRLWTSRQHGPCRPSLGHHWPNDRIVDIKADRSARSLGDETRIKPRYIARWRSSPSDKLQRDWRRQDTTDNYIELSVELGIPPKGQSRFKHSTLQQRTNLHKSLLPLCSVNLINWLFCFIAARVLTFHSTLYVMRSLNFYTGFLQYGQCKCAMPLKTHSAIGGFTYLLTYVTHSHI